MKLLRHGVAGILLFTVMIALCINIYGSITTTYEVTPNNQETINGKTGDIAFHLSQLTLVSGVSDINDAIIQLKNPSLGFDILGGLATAGIGVLKSIAGLITAPFEILDVITTFYGQGTLAIFYQLAALIIIYVGFILLSAYLRSDV